MLGDLVRYANLTHDQVLTSGYYEMHRLWSILMERRAADYMTLAKANDFPHLQDQARNEFWNEMKSLQPRRFKVRVIPRHILKFLAEKFQRGRRQ